MAKCCLGDFVEQMNCVHCSPFACLNDFPLSVLRKLFEIMGVLLSNHANCMTDGERNEIKNMLLIPLEDYVGKRREV